MNNEDLQNEEIDEVNTPSEENEEARTDKEYSDDYLTSAIEAILFSVGESVSIDRLASALEMDKRKLTKQLEGIIYNYNNSEAPLSVSEGPRCFVSDEEERLTRTSNAS